MMNGYSFVYIHHIINLCSQAVDLMCHFPNLCNDVKNYRIKFSVVNAAVANMSVFCKSSIYILLQCVCQKSIVIYLVGILVLFCRVLTIWNYCSSYSVKQHIGCKLKIYCFNLCYSSHCHSNCALFKISTFCAPCNIE